MSKTKPKTEQPATPTVPAKCPECGEFAPKAGVYCGVDHCRKKRIAAASVGIYMDDDVDDVVPDAMAIEEGKVVPLFDPAIKWLELRIPIVEYRAGAYLTKHVEIQCSPLEARGLRLLVGGVLKLNTKLANGRGLGNNPDAIRYILQEIAKAADDTKGGGS